MTWPALTLELKSTASDSIIPEIWLPTCTLTTGFNVPVAVTACVKSPRVTVPVWYCATPLREWLRYQAPKAPPARTNPITRSQRSQRNALLSAIKYLPATVVRSFCNGEPGMQSRIISLGLRTKCGPRLSEPQRLQNHLRYGWNRRFLLIPHAAARRAADRPNGDF